MKGSNSDSEDGISSSFDSDRDSDSSSGWDTESGEDDENNPLYVCECVACCPSPFSSTSGATPAAPSLPSCARALSLSFSRVALWG